MIVVAGRRYSSPSGIQTVHYGITATQTLVGILPGKRPMIATLGVRSGSPSWPVQFRL